MAQQTDNKLGNPGTPTTFACDEQEFEGMLRKKLCTAKKNYTPSIEQQESLIRHCVRVCRMGRVEAQKDAGLREIHDTGLYQALTPTWGGFLNLVFGISEDAKMPALNPVSVSRDADNGPDQVEQPDPLRAEVRTGPSPVRAKPRQRTVQAVEGEGAEPSGEAADAKSRRTSGPVSTGVRTPSIRVMMSSSNGDTADTSSKPNPEAPSRDGAAAVAKAQGKRQKKRSVNGTSSASPESRTPDYWAPRINAQMERTKSAFVEVGRILIEAKAALPHGEWLALFDRGLTSLSLREAEKLMKIAGHPFLANSANWSILPGAQQALLTLSRLSPEELEKAIKDDKINPTTTIREAQEIVAQAMGDEHGKPDATAPSTFDVAKVVARCLKPIKRAVEAAGEEHREGFLAELAAAVEALRSSG